MDMVLKAFGAIIKAIAMGLECLLWEGTDLVRNVVDGWYFAALGILAVINIYIPGMILIQGLVGDNWVTTTGTILLIAMMIVVVIVGFASRKIAPIILPIFFIALLVVFLVCAPNHPSGRLVMFSGFLFLALACVWGVAAIPATALLGMGFEIKDFVKKHGVLTRKSAPAPSPSPATTKPASAAKGKKR